MKFNKTLEAVNIMVMASYPAARFYEAQGILIEENNRNKEIELNEVKNTYRLLADNIIDIV
jgi:hypothetical protein